MSSKTKPKLDLSQYAEEFNESIIRNTLFSDFDLQRIYMTFFVHNPTSLPELVRTFNKTFNKNISKLWVYEKFKKIEHFGLFNKKPIAECKPEQDKEIIKKHTEWLAESGLPLQLQEKQKVTYYYLTEKGEEWANVVNEMLKRRLKQ